MKKFSRIFALAMVLIMALTVTVFAAEGSTSGTGKVSTSVTVNKNLIMDSQATVPATKFGFTLSARTGTEAFPLFNGIMDGVTVSGTHVTADENFATNGKFTVSFSSSSDVTEGKLPGETESFTTTKKYATEAFTVDFSGVTFPEPGVYRYIVTEDALTSPFGYYNTQTNVRYIDVYAEYESSDAVATTIQGIVVHTEDSTTPSQGTPAVGTLGGELASKSDRMDNEYTTYDLTLEKKVAGNQASRTQHFDFTIKIVNPTTANTTYPTSYKATVTCKDSGVTNPETVAVGGDGTVFHIKGGETVKIEGLPAGATYTITETTTGYTVTYTVTEEGSGEAGADSTLANNATGSEYANADGIAGDTTVTFTNTREGVVPTGVLLTVAPFAVLMLIGLAGVVIMLKKKQEN